MTQKKHTHLNIDNLDILTNDPNWTVGPYPIDDTPDNDFLIGLQPTPDVIVPPPLLPPLSLEPDAKVLSPFPSSLGNNTRPTKSSHPKDRDIPGTPRTVAIENLLPEHMRAGREGTSLLAPFLYNTVDKWITPPDLSSIGGYIGQPVEQSIVNENYIVESTEFATKNQLQPSIRTFASSSSTDLNMTWLEMLDKMKDNGLDMTKTDKFFATKKFSYQPPVSADKFSNYRYYYWTKTLGRWDITLASDNNSELILINGSLLGIADLLVGDYIRLNGVEFIVREFDIIASTIRIYDESERIFLESWPEISNSLVGHDRPAYHTQAFSRFITNGWISNNHWTHLDDLSVDEIEGFSGNVYPNASIPIIELLQDVVNDTSSNYIKNSIPNAQLYPLLYVDFNQTSIPINIESKIIGYDVITGDAILEERIGTIPVINKPILEYSQGPTHLNGESTELDPLLGINAIKETKEGSEYIFNNGLVDTENNDVRAGRFYVYLTHAAADELKQQYTHVQVTLNDVWVITHSLDYIPIVRVFLLNGVEVFPLSIVATLTTVTIRFNNPMAGIASLV